MASDPHFATAGARMVNHDELDTMISTWTESLDHREIFERCQAEGVPSGPVLDEADAYADPHLEAREFFRAQGSEDIGTWPFPGQQWRWSGPEMSWGPICRLGDSNDYIWRDVVGLSDEEYEALNAGGHLSLDYLQAGRNQLVKR